MKTKQLCRSGHTIFKEKCRACTELKKEWYSTLEATGFIDIENKLKNPSQYSISRIDTESKTQFEAKQSYYLWAQAQAEEAKFRSKIDSKIWTEYSKGETFRSMEGSIGLDHTWIYRKVKKIESYLKEQTRAIISSISYEAHVY